MQVFQFIAAALTVSVMSTVHPVAGFLVVPTADPHRQELHRPCPRALSTSLSPSPVRVASAAFTDAHDPRRVELLSRCDCGNLRGCRCADAMWDTLRARQQDRKEEEGMDDQGYRQLGY